MALYLNNESKTIYLNGVAYWLHIGTKSDPIKGIVIKTSDNYIVTDSSGVYLTLKESV